LPEAATDAMLALGDDFNIPGTFADGLMNPFLKDTRVKPREIFHTGNDRGRIIAHRNTLYLL
jgi:hypothetical protein